jgi:hypothetical protein
MRPTLGSWSAWIFETYQTGGCFEVCVTVVEMFGKTCGSIRHATKASQLLYKAQLYVLAFQFCRRSFFEGGLQSLARPVQIYYMTHGEILSTERLSWLSRDLCLMTSTRPTEHGFASRRMVNRPSAMRWQLGTCSRCARAFLCQNVRVISHVCGSPALFDSFS